MTFIELVAVMVIVGVLAAYALPRMLGRDAYAGRAYFDQLLQATRYTQKLAVATRCEARIVIAANSFSLQVPQAAGECGSPVNWVNTQLPGDGGPYTAPDGVNTAGTATITFLPSGRANGDYTVSVGALPYQFTVHAATGYVERL